jgi:hypothetical protein
MVLKNIVKKPLNTTATKQDYSCNWERGLHKSQRSVSLLP